MFPLIHASSVVSLFPHHGVPRTEGKDQKLLLMQRKQERISCEFPPEQDLWQEMYKARKIDGIVINMKGRAPGWGNGVSQGVEVGVRNEGSSSGGAESRQQGLS